MAPNIDRLIRMYLGGGIGNDLASLVQGWLLMGDTPEQDVSLRRSFDRMVHPRSYADNYTRRSLSALHDELGFEKGRARTSLVMRYAAVAVFVFAVVLGGVVSWSLFNDSGNVIVAEHTVTGEAGSECTATFPDGTLVTLKGASTITYKDDYSEQRHLCLNGEAYFVVSHDAGRPFTVTGGDVRVRVLGTEFNMRSSHTIDVAEVVLVEGIVDVSNHEESALLEPGQKATVNIAAGTMQVGKADAGELARYEGRPLSLYDVTLYEALHSIGEYFEVRMDIAASVPRIEGVVFNPGEDTSLEQAMKVLRISNPVFQYTIQGSTVSVR